MYRIRHKGNIMYRMIAKIVMSIPSLRGYLLDELGYDRYGRDYLEMQEYVHSNEHWEKKNMEDEDRRLEDEYLNTIT